MHWKPKPWQRRIVRAALTTPTTLFTIGRGNGKSTLAARLLEACMTPGTEWHRPAGQSYIVAGSVAQARRTTWGILTPILRGLEGVRVHDTPQDCSAVHVASGARVSVVASNADRALGIVNSPLIVGDEPASWGPSGEAMYDALKTSLGKPGDSSRLMLIGTLHPHRDTDWWPQLIEGGDAPRAAGVRLPGRPRALERDERASPRQPAHVGVPREPGHPAP